MFGQLYKHSNEAKLDFYYLVPSATDVWIYPKIIYERFRIV